MSAPAIPLQSAERHGIDWARLALQDDALF